MREPTTLGSAEERHRPLRAELGMEREEHDPLPLPEPQAPVAEGDLLGAGAEERVDEPLARRGFARHDALEEALEVLEESRLALLDPDEREARRRRDVGDAVRP